MGKKIYSGDENKRKLLEGVNELADTVKLTMGAAGLNVIIHDQFRLPHVTKDGVTVAKNISFDDPVKDSGAKLVKQAAIKTVELAGDGTTLSTVLAQALIVGGYDLINKGVNPVELKKGMEKAAEVALEEVKKLAIPVTENKQIVQIATISANNDSSIGELIGSAFATMGNEGLLEVQESKSHETTIKVMNGIEFEKGYISPLFANNQAKMEAELFEPYILLYEGKISTIEPVMPLLNAIASNNKPVLIIAEDVDGEALQTMALNTVKKNLQICVVRAPGFAAQRTDMMEDLACVTGGVYVMEEKSMKLSGVSITELGRSEKVIVTKDRCRIVGGKGDRELIEIRVARIKKEAEDIQENDFLKEATIRRAASLTNGIAVISVGGNTEAEMKERRDRVDDAKCATKAAIEEGYVAGGGATLLMVSRKLKDEIIYGLPEGINLLADSLAIPFKQILDNAHVDANDIGASVLTKGYPYGYNVKTEAVEDMIASGVVDPAKVIRVALQNAVSVAGVFFLAGATIHETQTENNGQTNPFVR